MNRRRLACVAIITPWLLAGAPPRAADTAGRSRGAPAQAGPAQSMRIDIRGAVAHVTVTRQFSCGGKSASERRSPAAASPSSDEGGAGRDVVLDVALPARASLLQVEMGAGRLGARPRPLQVLPPAQARDGYLEGLRALRLSASEVAFDDEARFRVRAACPSLFSNQSAMLTYTFAVLLELHNGVARLAFPPAAELSPPATRVDVRVAWPLEVAEISIGGASHAQIAGAVAAATETVSARSAWNVSVIPRAAADERGEAPRLTALASLASGGSAASGGAGPARALLAYALGAGGGGRQPLPERVLFLIDRSRSVGPGGLEVERDAARKLLEALPPSTRFDALFFDRTQQVLFPLTRAATREAITALEDEMVPAHLANGTDLVAALRHTGELLRRNAADFAPRCLLVVLTDGAVGVPPAAAKLAAMLGPLPGIELMVAAVSVRANDDTPVSPAERRVLRGLAAAASLGGVERNIRAADLTDALPALLETLRGRGDLYGVAIRTGEGDDREARAASANTEEAVADVLEPSSGVSGVLSIATAKSMAAAAARTTAITYRGARRPLPLRPVAVDRRWLQPLATPSVAEARLLVSPGLVALVEPVVRPTGVAAAAEVSPSGYMERSVVRDALSLAFTPRARACYLNRTAPTAADRDLAGRVRVALDLVRGEVADVRVDLSTLAHVGIENCLREAAYAIEVPRAYRNDEPVTAVLNLVFRPRTPDRRAGAVENPSLSREIDLMVEAALKDKDAAEIPAPAAAAPPSPGPSDAGAKPAGPPPPHPSPDGVAR